MVLKLTVAQARAVGLAPKRAKRVRRVKAVGVKVTEASVLSACLQLLALKKIPAWRNNNAGVRRQDKTGRQWWQFSGAKGCADILGLLPPGGRLLAIETKAGKGKLTPEQRAFLTHVNEAGGLGFVVWSVAELESFLRDMGY